MPVTNLTCCVFQELWFTVLIAKVVEAVRNKN